MSEFQVQVIQLGPITKHPNAGRVFLKLAGEGYLTRKGA